MVRKQLTWGIGIIQENWFKILDLLVEESKTSKQANYQLNQNFWLVIRIETLNESDTWLIESISSIWCISANPKFGIRSVSQDLPNAKKIFWKRFTVRAPFNMLTVVSTVINNRRLHLPNTVLNGQSVSPCAPRCGCFGAVAPMELYRWR